MNECRNTWMVEWIPKSKNQLLNGHINESIESMNPWKNEAIKESLTHWMNEWMNEWMNDQGNQWIVDPQRGTVTELSVVLFSRTFIQMIGFRWVHYLTRWFSIGACMHGWLSYIIASRCGVPVNAERCSRLVCLCGILICVFCVYNPPE